MEIKKYKFSLLNIILQIIMFIIFINKIIIKKLILNSFI